MNPKAELARPFFRVFLLSHSVLTATWSVASPDIQRSPRLILATSQRPNRAYPHPTQRPEDEDAPSAICIGEHTRRDLNQAHILRESMPTYYASTPLHPSYIANSARVLKLAAYSSPGDLAGEIAQTYSRGREQVIRVAHILTGSPSAEMKCLSIVRPHSLGRTEVPR